MKGGQHWVHMEIMEGAYGGRHDKDGMDAVDTLYANTRNNPIEDIESHIPVRIEAYELREDRMAAGENRGGLGATRVFRFLEDAGISIEGEGHRFRPWGFDGGDDGQVAVLTLDPAEGEDVALPSKLPYKRVRAGDSLVAQGPCGGGYGNPLLRDPALVLDDVLDDLLSPETARRDYGVVIAGGAVDAGATAAERAARGG